MRYPMMLPMYIARDDIPLFFSSGCIVDVTKWKVGDTSFKRWCASCSSEDDPSSQWRDEVIIPHFQQRFDMLKVDVNGCLYGMRGETEEKIDERFYDPQLLRKCLGAKCSGQGWHFALGCCMKQHMK